MAEWSSGLLSGIYPVLRSLKNEASRGAIAIKFSKGFEVQQILLRQ
jgi:hypothetical protein